MTPCSMSPILYFKLLFSALTKVKSTLNIMLLFETNLYMLNCCLYKYAMFYHFKKLFRRRALTFEGALTFETLRYFQAILTLSGSPVPGILRCPKVTDYVERVTDASPGRLEMKIKYVCATRALKATYNGNQEKSR